MALFGNLRLTEQGIAFVERSVLGGGSPLVFVSIGIGCGKISGNDDPWPIESLVDERLQVPIESLNRDANGKIVGITGRLSTDMLDSDLVHRELGIYVDDRGGSLLFAYANAGDAYDFIPAAGAGAAITKEIKVSFEVGTLDIIYRNLPSGEFVTHVALENRINEVLPGLAHDAMQDALSATGNVFLTDKTNIVTGLTSYTQPVNVANATGDGHAVTRLQVERGDGIKSPSQHDFRALGFCSRVGGNPACYMDRLYNIGDTPIAFGQLNGFNDGDGNNYAGTILTMTLDLPYMAEAIRQPDYIDRASLGQTAYFGACATFPGAGCGIIKTMDSTGNLVKTYDCQVAGWDHYSYKTFIKSVPAIYSSDYHADKQLRVGFCQNMLGVTETEMLANMTDDNIKYGLLAHLPDDAVRIILVWAGNAGTLTRFLPGNCTGMWVQRYDGSINFVGWSMTNYGWAKIGLIMLAYGKSGLGAFRNFRGDIYGLASGTRPSSSQLYPLSKCMFVATNEATTRQANILLPDKSCSITLKDEWISVAGNDAGLLYIEIDANSTGIARRGLCDVKLSNGLTYSLHVTQKA